MNIKSVAFRMNVEVGPYKHEHVEVVVELKPGESVDKAYKLAQTTARKLLGVDVSEEDVLKAKQVLAASKRSRRVGMYGDENGE